MKASASYISKTLFIKGLQCRKALFLHKYRPELKDEISEAQEAVFRSGTEVGILAQGLFPGGVEIPYENRSLKDQMEETKALISEGRDTIYEAAFSYEGAFCKVDILHKGKKGWEIYEVKSSTELKDVYLDDLAFQYHVLKSCGLDIAGAWLVHIDNQYVREGDIAVERLFRMEELTDIVSEREPLVISELSAQRNMLAGELPAIDIGPQCDDPYPCDFKGHCWSHIPEDSVFSLRGRGVNKFGLYRRGILAMEDVPRELLNFNQFIQVAGTLEGKERIIRENIREFLDTLWYPMCFLDFETFMVPVPPFDGTRPYQQIAFQYSLHIRGHEGAALRHSDFLAKPGYDPRRDLAEKLLGEVPEGACVIAYNKSFETGRLRDMASWFPEYGKRLAAMIDDMRDLMLPFRGKDCYLPGMKGSYSIKAVLPALVPELSYEGMAISDGGMAMNAYSLMCETKDMAELEKIRKALLEYCELDTLAMVRVLERLEVLSR